MAEEYCSSDKLLDLHIGAVTQVHSEDDQQDYSTVFVGVDYGRSVLTRLPAERYIPDGQSPEDFFVKDRKFEMRTIHEGRIIAFETAVSEIYANRLLLSSFPEMLETRLLRSATRFPCAISCDIHFHGRQSYGVISNISHGGCLITVDGQDTEFLVSALDVGNELTLEVFFPPMENPEEVNVIVRSATEQANGDVKVGASFTMVFEAVERYLESLQLDSIAPFFR